ncbi:uncharacterized protein ALTATR162_LOCUS9519 [Alternaria atra]|uniref:Uncharacterized protein n=1 Tax=Alternaria atra TaxID=119953 RepID=A0A8J2I7T2_9PLEO|nr:uncharacterized protein ALTATR162_LOCUS9519 [Alternaria atra]CAG5180952.1 unnamed protein product [Alternaria atra]
MFASNFVVKDTNLKHLHSKGKLTRFKQNNTTTAGKYMGNSFSSICGTLKYQDSSGYLGTTIPRIKVFEMDRCAWLEPAKV